MTADDRTGDADSVDGDPVDHVSLDEIEGRPGAVAVSGPPRVVRLALDAGESVPPHDHPGTTVLLYVVEGAVDARLDGEPHEVAAGELLRFPGERTVAPLAVQDAVALVFLVDDAA